MQFPARSVAFYLLLRRNDACNELTCSEDMSVES